MVTIQIENGSLDVGSEQTIELEVTNIRFAEGIRDPFTNDFDIPKTENNIRLLECYNLLDSPNQLYGQQLKPAVLTCDGYMMDCYIQVVSVNDDSISICLYESVLPAEIRDKKVKEVLHDTENTIYVWSTNTKDAYPNDFRRYDYGSTYDKGYAQYHAIKHVNDVIDDLGAAIGYTLPHTDNDLGLLAQNKYVCPENKRQSLMWTITNADHNLVIEGGQHVVNDVEGWNGHTMIGNSTVTSVTFNRKCTATIHYYITWVKKASTGLNTFVVELWKNGQPLTGRSITTQSLGLRNGLMTGTWTIPFEDGDTIQMTFDSPTTSDPQKKFEAVMCTMDIEYSNYTITDEDYGTELKYCNWHPFIIQWETLTATLSKIPLDGRQYTYNEYGIYAQPEYTIDIYLPWRGISYFGYYANISDITVGGLFYSLCWYMGKALTLTPNGLEFVDCNKSKSIDAYINEIRPSSEKLGRKNYIIWNSADTDNSTAVSEIDSVWLEDTKILHESEFAEIKRGFLGRARVEQYQITYEDDEDGNTTVNVEYSEIDGTVVMRYQTHENSQSHWNLELIPPHALQLMDFGDIKTATEVEIETFDTEVSDMDYLYIDGRKFMVITADVDLKTKQTNITALLVPTKDLINNGNHIFDITDIRRQ